MVRYSIDSILEFIFGIKRERERESKNTEINMVWPNAIVRGTSLELYLMSHPLITIVVFSLDKMKCHNEYLK